MVRVGGLTSKYYVETKGLKASGGQKVKAGTVLTREGHRWKPGKNVTGDMHLNAMCDGEIYFTKTRASKGGKVLTFINVRPEVVKAAKQDKS